MIEREREREREDGEIEQREREIESIQLQKRERWSHRVSDPDLGDEDVGAQVHRPPVTLVRSRPETCLLCQEAIHRLSWGVVLKHTTGGGWGGGKNLSFLEECVEGMETFVQNNL